VLVLYPVLLVSLLGGPRLFYRVWKDHSISLKSITTAQRVLVLGAGRAGEMLVREMRRDNAYLPVGFLDDGKGLANARVHGIPVLGCLDDLPAVIHKGEIDFIVIALPSATNQQMQHVVELCEKSGVPFRTVPRIEDMMAGQVSINELRAVSIDDLLGRDKVELDWEMIHKGLSGKTVMVTGGGGSIGAELVRQIARTGPTELVIFEQNEYNLYRVEMDIRREFPALNLRVVLGDVCDKDAIEYVFSSVRPDVVFHAAAYKHVPMLQNKIREAVRNNVIGTCIVADAANRNKSDSFVMISTDKAVKPPNIMGASKRIAELICEGMAKKSSTRFITVRFGNVLASAGSVVPLFQEQIKAGGPVTVTHPDITRFFMTITEACQLILQAGAMGAGGEIFVLNMGEPVRITYLAEQLIRLSGRRPGTDIEIVFTGLRAGEKLHEELFHLEEKPRPTTHEKILLARQHPFEWERLERIVAEMEQACARYDERRLQVLIRELVPELDDSASPAINNVVELQQKA